MKNLYLLGLIIVIIGVAIGVYGKVTKNSDGSTNEPRIAIHQFEEDFSIEDSALSPTPYPAQEAIITNLSIPWEIVQLPDDGRMLITERSGRVLLVGEDSTIIELDGVAHVGEGGLQGAAVDPAFAENRFVYLYYTTERSGALENVLARYELDGSSLLNETIVLDGIRGARVHDGGRVAFGPDGYLYVATGDAGDTQSAQDTSSLNGKILRIRPDGGVPADNPFGNAVFSYGHRNVQGLAWDEEGRLWATEHGPSGLSTGWDELNLIESGNNYGWPHVKGDETGAGYTNPVIHSGTSTWAPAGAAYLDGSIYFAGLRGETLYIYDIDKGTLREALVDQYGRLRAVVVGQNDSLLISTSNRDGRGSPVETDDRIIRINPSSL